MLPAARFEAGVFVLPHPILAADRVGRSMESFEELGRDFSHCRGPARPGLELLQAVMVSL